MKLLNLAKYFQILLLMGMFSCYSNREKIPIPYTKPTCDDGLLNQNEENIDCGGPCLKCYQDPPCVLTKNAFSLEKLAVSGNYTYTDADYSFGAGGYRIQGANNDISHKTYIIFYGKPIKSSIYSIGDIKYLDSVAIGIGTYNAIDGLVYMKVDHDSMDVSFCNLTFVNYESPYDTTKGSGRIKTRYY